MKIYTIERRSKATNEIKPCWMAFTTLKAAQYWCKQSNNFKETANPYIYEDNEFEYRIVEQIED